MNIKTLAKKDFSYDCSIPDWLQQCMEISGDLVKSDTSVSKNGDLIVRAFQFAYQLHRGQYRKSGEPYINHPIAVAGLLRYLGGDSAMVAAGFLHDIIEDTEVTPEELEQHFGAEVRHLVEGVTKLSKFNFSNTTERQAENFRRMFLAMAKDIRVAQLAQVLRERLEKAGIKCYEVSGRPKHLYGIYKKMNQRQKQFHEIYDIAALRVIVETNEECYRTLAIVHDAFRPIPGRFKDYIGLPKPNRYQSLHTGVIGNTGRAVEIQIRTVEMHHIAEYGIAAHWKYKEKGNSNMGEVTGMDDKFTWLRQLLEWQSDLKDATEYLESVKSNLEFDDVYVFTPEGDVIALTHGATPVDFAYRIHSEVGNHCKGAKVNERIVTLDTPLKNGDIVEILTQKNIRPSLDWLNFVKTNTAKNRIRQWYKRSHRDENIDRGRELLEKEMGKNGFESLLKSEPMLSVSKRFNYHNVDDLLAALGYGEITLNLVVNRLRDVSKSQNQIQTVSQELTTTSLQVPHLPSYSQLPSSSPSNSPITGVEGLLYHIAGCCNPIPGEPIIGVVTRTKGISIHQQGCSNTLTVEGERFVPLSWNPNYQQGGRPQTYGVNICIEVLDRVGVLNDILSRLKDNNINVCSAQVKTFRDAPALIELGIEICDREQFERTCTQIKNISDVLTLRRINSK
ncbi:bifunctional (p)ppGpp synthetase/guanosine-3',5'-bis(diphosphate) 3'-pyrophosphohydrolase [Planktothrix agardhii 1033]|nr:bifunctional (p)ppGpp synthetase/guanosine-3',5'-bis(diphosphate) 3'-pyrophosphohydrolase [Planktothrix agardhii 1033]